MNTTASNEQSKGLIDKGFDLDKRVNRTLIVAGLGIAAVGSVVAAPAIATFGALTAGGSIAGLAVTDRLKDGYESMRAKRTTRIGQKVTRSHFALAA